MAGSQVGQGGGPGNNQRINPNRGPRNNQSRPPRQDTRNSGSGKNSFADDGVNYGKS